jgi:exodeoxyribonuclease-3
MKFVSWNVNGLRAVCGKGFADIFTDLDADFFCLQEIKLSAGQLDLQFPGYEAFWNYAERKGYSGTAIFSRHKPLSVTYGMGIAEHDSEGRVITLEMPEFFLVTVYTPNSKDGLLRLEYRMEWEVAFREYLLGLDARKPVIVCGDMNVAHKEIDLKNPSTNRRSAGFTDEERACMTQLLDSGFTDSFRHLYPDLEGAYSWWSYRMRARERNAGWRIDYFLVSDRLADKINEARIHNNIFGSDHCPVEVEMNL